MNMQQLHFEDYAAKTEWKKLLVDSTFVLALLSDIIVRTVSAKVVTNLGWDKVKATHPASYCKRDVLVCRNVPFKPDSAAACINRST